MKVHHFNQHSDSWWEARRGVPTASNFHKLISGAKAIKGVPPYSLKPTGSASYIRELVAEVATLSPNYFTEKDRIARSRETQYGLETEDEARQWLAMHIEKPIRKVGFITTDNEELGCSPDGVIHDDTGSIIEGAELKCPRLDTQAGYLETPNEVPKDYLPQVHGALAVTGLNRWHFCSYAPGLAPLYVLVERNWYTEKLEAVLEAFVKAYHAKLHEHFPELAELDEWRKFLADDPSLDVFNERLPQMSRLPYAVKRRVWKIVQDHARLGGMMFDEGTKRFFIPQSQEQGAPF